MTDNSQTQNENPNRKSLYPISHIFLSNKIIKYFSNPFSNPIQNLCIRFASKSFLNLVIEIFHGTLQSPSGGRDRPSRGGTGDRCISPIIFLKPISQNQNQKIFCIQLSHFFPRGGQQNILKPK